MSPQDASSPPAATARALPGRVEFVVLMAMLSGTVAFSIDAMLPALEIIGTELSPAAVNRAQLVVTSFVFGMGLGTFFMGPVSDAAGRNRVIMAGTALYMLGALLAALTPSLELLVLSRVLQGLGVSAARVVSMAIIRDLYKGREMARLMSFVMMVFALVPAIAPLIGAGIISVAGWRGIFGSFILFAALYSLWIRLRLPEALPVERRRAFRARALWRAGREVVGIPLVRLAIMVQALCFGALFASLSSIQQIVADTFGRAAQFPYWFGMIAVISGGFSLLNASLVMRLGMRRLINVALSGQVAICLVALVLLHSGAAGGLTFALYIAWQTTVFIMITLTLGNLNALAMEPLGHVAGMGASITVGLATVGSVLLAIPVGQAFDGTPTPLMLGVLAYVGIARLIMLRLERIERYDDA